jgi:hypothetical protein
VLEEYMDRQKQTIETALTGTASPTTALTIMGTLGLKGTGQVKHYELSVEQDMMVGTAYTDMGYYTTVSRSVWNNSTLIMQTQSRMYMVSLHYMEGTALSMSETRIIAPIHAQCAIMVHIQHGRYRIMQSGTMMCWAHGTGLGTVTLTAGNIVHLDERDFCSNECMQVGSKGFMREDRSIVTQPTVHPESMKQFQDSDKDDRTNNMQIMKLDNAHQIIHDMMTKDIKDNEDIIQEIRDSQNNENIDWGFHMGTMGVAVSVITALSLLLVCVRCAWLRRNKAGCTLFGPGCCGGRSIDSCTSHE